MTILSGIQATKQNSFYIGDGYSNSSIYIYSKINSPNNPNIRFNTSTKQFEQSNNGLNWYKLIDKKDIDQIIINYNIKSINTYEYAQTIITNPTNTTTQYEVHTLINNTSTDSAHISICNFGVRNLNNSYNFVGYNSYSLSSDQIATYIESDDSNYNVNFVLDAYTGLLTFQYKSGILNSSATSVVVPINQSTIKYRSFTRSADWWNGKTCTEWNYTKNKLIKSICASGGTQQICSYSSSAILQNAYEGCVFSPGKKVYFVPYAQGNQSTWHYLDLNTESIISYSNGVTALQSAYAGGVLSPDGKIYLIPSAQATQSTWHYVNTNTNTITAYSPGVTGVNNAYFGGVLAPNGRIYMIPYGQSNQTTWHYIDTSTGTVTGYLSNISAVANAYAGGVLSPNGRIYLIPSAQATQTNWHYIDTNTNTVVSYTSGISAVNGAYQGGVLDYSGKIYMIPFNQGLQSTWHYIDTNTNTVVGYAHGATVITQPYSGGVLAPNGKIYMIPYNQSTQSSWHYIDTNNGTVVSYTNNLTINQYGYNGGVLANNTIYMAPYGQSNQSTWHSIQTNSELPLLNSICLNPMFNKF